MYERNLIEYLPYIIRDVREYQAILTDAEQPEMIILWQAADYALDDQFINYATENGVSRWEKILGIVPKATEVLDARKFTILTRINEQLPLTSATLDTLLKSLCGENGYTYEIDGDHYMVSVLVELTAKSNLNDVEALLNRVIPANMVIRLGLRYNQHEKLSQFTHEQLAAYTQNQIRNEVINQWQRTRRI